jgi:hypothetical protein
MSRFERGLKPLPNEFSVIIIKNNLTTNYKLLLNCNKVHRASSVAHVFPDMKINSLLSVGYFCNEGYYVTFKIDGIKKFNHEGKGILKGHRDLGTVLWRINLRKDTPQIPIDAFKMV